MPKNTSVTIGDHFSDFIGACVQDGRYASASEVVRAGLRLLEEREAAMAALRAAIDEGEASGPGAPLDFDAFVAARRAQR